MENPQGRSGVRIKAFEEVKTDEKLCIFIRSNLLSGQWILKFYVSMPMSQDNGLVEKLLSILNIYFLKQIQH